MKASTLNLDQLNRPVHRTDLAAAGRSEAAGETTLKNPILFLMLLEERDWASTARQRHLICGPAVIYLADYFLHPAIMELETKKSPATIAAGLSVFGLLRNLIKINETSAKSSFFK